MKSLFSFIILFSPLAFLTGCFDFLNPANKAQEVASSDSAITASDFTGVAAASNKVTGILISWPAISNTSLVKAYRIYRVTGSTKTLLTSVAPSLSSFIDGTATWGTIYTYMVKAVDQKDIEDSNTKTVKALSWAGISSVTGLSRSSLQVNLQSVASVVDEVRIYGQLSIGGTKTLLATATGSDSSVEINSLRTGYKYIISAQAYVNSLGKEDGNDINFTANTYTVGYDDDGTSTAQWRNVVQVRAFGESPAAPVHPATINKSPQARVVELVFNSFSSVGTTAKYVVTRVIDGNLMDSSVSSSCFETTTSSCRVCDSVVASNGVITCRDTAVAASPARYRYSISLVQTDLVSGDTWVEPLPSTLEALSQVSVLVPIPPKNMVLTQRDAANYEMCLQLNRSSDPRNFNRCPYSGVGAVPYSSGHNRPALNLATGYYDFGYNLFVDRWELACNWTRAAAGGMCGANHSAGDCINYGDAATNIGRPTPGIGKVGDVFLWLVQNQTRCYVASSVDASGAITWTDHAASRNLPNSPDLYQKMFTNDPGYIYSDASGNPAYNTALPGKRTKQNYIDQVSAAAACNAFVDSNYGTKRLSRLREYSVYSAPAILPTELYTSGNYNNFMNTLFVSNAYHNSSYNYGCENGTNRDPTPSTLEQLLDTSPASPYRETAGVVVGLDTAGHSNKFGTNVSVQFMIGAVATIDCQSRYGVQDMMAFGYMNDVMTYNATTSKLTGIASPYDNGNRDLLSDISGGTTGYVMDISNFDTNATARTLSKGSSVMTAFIPPLSLPIATASYSSDYLPKASWLQTYSASYTVPGGSNNAPGVKVVSSFARFGVWIFISPNISSTDLVRCVLPAE
jgi:hypothetical protein